MRTNQSLPTLISVLIILEIQVVMCQEMPPKVLTIPPTISLLIQPQTVPEMLLMPILPLTLFSTTRLPPNRISFRKKIEEILLQSRLRIQQLTQLKTQLPLPTTPRERTYLKTPLQILPQLKIKSIRISALLMEKSSSTRKKLRKI